MKALIFLDLDGVLHTAYHDAWLSFWGKPLSDELGAKFSPSCIRNLAYLIKRTRAGIVIISNWRHFGLLKMRDIWEKRRLPGTIVGVTPFLTGPSGMEEDRQQEILRWLQDNQALNVPISFQKAHSEKRLRRKGLAALHCREYPRGEQ